MTEPSVDTPDARADATAEALAGDLERWSTRLADPAAAITATDAREVEWLAAAIADLRVRNGHGRRDRGLPDDLHLLYESPFATSTVDLEALAATAATVRERAWARAGEDLPEIRPATAPPIEPTAVAPATSPPDDEPVEIAAATATPAARPGFRRWAGLPVVVEVATVVGVLLVVLFLYATFGTGLAAAQSQRQLDRTFDERLRVAASSVTEGGVQESGVLGQDREETEEQAEAANDAAAEEASRTPDPGEPVAILSLPTIGSRHIVVEGTRPSELQAGPGHVRSTPLPGRAGNTVIFGRRTTYGGPFADVNDLRPGDPIDVTTTEGQFRYVVQDLSRVGPGDPDPITATFSNRLTLVTSDGRSSTTGRFVAYGTLQGPPVPTPTDESGSPQPLPIVNDDEIGTRRSTVDWALLLLWTQAIALVYLGTRWCYRNWRPWSTWLVSAPIFVLVTLNWLDSVVRMFPSTL